MGEFQPEKAGFEGSVGAKGKRMVKSLIVKRFSTVFAVLYIIPMLVTLYLLFTLLDLRGKSLQVSILIFFCVLLGISGQLILRAIVRSLVETVENVKAVAAGDFRKKESTGTPDALEELTDNFNKITDNLRKNIANLEKSNRQIQTLLSHIAKAIESPVEIDRLLAIYLSSITSLIGYKKGVAIIMAKDGQFRILSSVGLTKDEVTSFFDAARCVLRGVVDSGRPLVIHNGLEDGESGAELGEQEGIVKQSVSVPLIKSQRVFGVLTLAEDTAAAGEDGGEDCATATKKMSGDDIVMLQNLAAQMSTVIENLQLREDMEKTYFESISALAAAVEARDIYTNGHSERVSILSVEIAKNMGLHDRIVKLVHDGSLLHDIGKIGIPDTILHYTKPRLPEEFYEVIKTHPVIGENIVKPLHSLRGLCAGVRHHHERFDGKGYPDGLSGKDIPVESRVMAVADAFDAMTSDRSYRRMMSRSEAVLQLEKNSGTQFDADCVQALIEHLKKNPEVFSREWAAPGEKPSLDVPYERSPFRKA